MSDEIFLSPKKRSLNMKLLLTFTPNVRQDWSFGLLTPFKVQFVAFAIHREGGVFLTEKFVVCSFTFSRMPFFIR